MSYLIYWPIAVMLIVFVGSLIYYYRGGGHGPIRRRDSRDINEIIEEDRAHRS